MLKPGDKVEIEFFDSMKMGNRTEEGIVVEASETSALIEVRVPIRKRIRVPLEFVTVKEEVTA